MREKDLIETCARNGERWKPPKERVLEKKAEVLTLSEYGKTVIDQRILKPRTRIEYEAKWSQLIEPKLGKLAIRDVTTTAVRAWFAGLDATKPTRNGHAYSILNMICNTAVKEVFAGIGGRRVLTLFGLHHGVAVHLGPPSLADQSIRPSSWLRRGRRLGPRRTPAIPAR